MSEYQYYEFQAVDRPLTPQQMDELRALSSRATITPNSFSNTYNFGSFRGDPQKLMETYFDAHVYVSNFGTVTFLLRLPRGVLPHDTITQYASDDALEWWITDAHTILEWRYDGEPPDDWVEGEGWMGRLLPIRDELVRGDYRALYIGWLSSAMGELWDADTDNADPEADGEDDSLESRREPPVPAGLGSLTGSQAALVEFLEVDSDLLAVAAEASPALTANKVSDQSVDAWVSLLPEQELRTIVARIIRGEGPQIQAELQSRYHRSHSEPAESSRGAGAPGRGRTAGDLAARAVQAARKREQQEQDAREQKRRAHLAGLVPRFSALWATVNALAEEQKSSSYEKVCALLVDMRDAYAHAGHNADFDVELARFLEKHGRRTALARRLKEAGISS